jgi:hypothetical protein
VRGEMWPSHLALEHLELVPQHHDLDLLCVLGAKAQEDELKGPAQGPVQEGHDHEVARLGFHGPRRLWHPTEPAWAPRCNRSKGRLLSVDSSFRHRHGDGAEPKGDRSHKGPVVAEGPSAPSDLSAGEMTRAAHHGGGIGSSATRREHRVRPSGPEDQGG